MNSPLKAVVVFILTSAFFSCKKDTSNTGLFSDNLSEVNQSSIIRKWSIVTDSAFTGFAQYQKPFDYAGRPGDYFDFRTDGNVYTKEGNVFDTLKYSFKAINKIVISLFGGVLNGVPEVSDITASHNQIIIFAPWIYTPGGVVGRKVTLSY
jgi:hypothetical protein